MPALSSFTPLPSYSDISLLAFLCWMNCDKTCTIGNQALVFNCENGSVWGIKMFATVLRLFVVNSRHLGNFFFNWWILVVREWCLMYFKRLIYEEIICTSIFVVVLNLELETSWGYYLHFFFPLEFSEPSPLLLLLLTIAFFHVACWCMICIINLSYSKTFPLESIGAYKIWVK